MHQERHISQNFRPAWGALCSNFVGGATEFCVHSFLSNRFLLRFSLPRAFASIVSLAARDPRITAEAEERAISYLLSSISSPAHRYNTPKLLVFSHIFMSWAYKESLTSSGQR